MKSNLRNTDDFTVYPIASNGEEPPDKDEVCTETSRYFSAMDKPGTNWKLVFTLMAAALGLGAAAAFWIRTIQKRRQDFDLRIEDAVEFCRVKTQELDNLLRETAAF